MLRSLRQLRAGSLDLGAVEPGARSLLGMNVAGCCRALASWVDREVLDPRAADAFLRTYGLGRMPESRMAIGRSLRSPTGRAGISPGAVDVLVRGVEAQLAQQVSWVSLPGPWGSPTPLAWRDPFPAAVTCPGERRQLQRVLYTAWADVPAEPLHECIAALLLYEQEHGLRPGPTVTGHREQRRRLRRLAWSMLTVARERHVAKEPDDVLVDLLLGPRRLAVVEHLPQEAAALLVGAGHDPDRIGEALAHVRGAVRDGRPESPELLGLLREAVARGGPAQPTFTAGAAALSTIVAREQRLPSGVLAASEAVALATEVAEERSWAVGGDRRLRRQQTSILNDGLRAAQELAELHDSLGNARPARRALAAMTRLRRALDPGDQGEVQGWCQQNLQTRSTLARHSAAAGRHPAEWLRQADRDAHLSLDLAESEHLLPGYRLVPASQLLATAIASLRLHPTSGGSARARLERLARRHLASARELSQAAGGHLDRPTQSARLSVARRWWELALLCGDPDEVEAARRDARGLVRSCTLPHDLQKLAGLESRSRARGIAAVDPPIPGPSADT